jgi:hypothetical protein
VLCLALAISSAWAQPAPPPAGTWAQIPNTKIIDAMAMAEFYSGPNAYNPRSLFDFSGGDLLQRNGVWGFVVTGGGHAATPDNSTIFVPFDSSGARQLQGPYTSPDGVYRYDVPYDVYKPSGIWTDARKSVHTYSCILTIQKGGQPFLFLYGGSTYTGAGGGTATTRLFDLAQTRAQAMARADLGWQKVASAPRGATSSSCVWDAAGQRIAVRSQSFVGAYYPEQNRWEQWAVNPVATLCCDFASAPAFDPATRTLYVLGDGLAEQYTLANCPGTGCYADLSQRPWASRFVARGMQGPGVAWHTRTKQIVAWMQDGNSLDVINPATNTKTTVPMGGVTVSAPVSAGTYGRFRLLPGTDTVVLANYVYENVYIGTVPFGGAPTPVPPPPSPPPPSAVTFTALPATMLAGQPSVLTLSLPGTNYHNIVINGIRPTCVWGATSGACTMTVTPLATTLYQAAAINAAGTPYLMPSVTVTIQTAPPPPPPPPPAVVTLSALPATIQPGQSSVLTLALPGLDYHNIFISGVRPACMAAGSTATCTLAVTPAASTEYQATATNAAGTPYTMPRVTVTVQAAPPPPPPPPPTPPSAGTITVPPGQPIPPRQWVERPMPPQGQAYMAGNGGKHGRAFYHAGLKGLVFAGGDWRSSMSWQLGLDGNFEGSEIWTLNALTDTWRLLRQLCIPGAVQPGRPDSVNWAYDSLRDRGLMAPGFYAITQGGASAGCGAVEGFGGYAFSFATKAFTGPDALAGLPPPPNGWGGDDGAAFGLYDPVADEFVRVRNGPRMERLNLATRTWRVQELRLTAGWNPVPNRAQPVIDVQGRALYWLDTGTRSLIKVSLRPITATSVSQTPAVTAIPLPAAYVVPGDSSQEVYLAFDSVNRVVVVPNNTGMGQSPIVGLGLYAVDAGTWTWETVPTAVWGSVWGYDEQVGALVGIGKRQSPTAYFLYKVR